MMRRDAYEEIAQERIAQDKQWGGPEHDDRHTVDDWVEYIRKHSSRALRLTRRRQDMVWTADDAQKAKADDATRRQLVILGALAVAALQSFDRKHPKKP